MNGFACGAQFGVLVSILGRMNIQVTDAALERDTKQWMTYYSHKPSVSNYDVS